MLARTVKDLPAHRYQTSGTIVRVDNASDDNNGPLNKIRAVVSLASTPGRCGTAKKGNGKESGTDAGQAL